MSETIVERRKQQLSRKILIASNRERGRKHGNLTQGTMNVELNETKPFLHLDRLSFFCVLKMVAVLFHFPLKR